MRFCPIGDPLPCQPVRLHRAIGLLRMLRIGPSGPTILSPDTPGIGIPLYPFGSQALGPTYTRRITQLGRSRPVG